MGKRLNVCIVHVHITICSIASLIPPAREEKTSEEVLATCSRAWLLEVLSGHACSLVQASLPPLSTKMAAPEPWVQSPLPGKASCTPTRGRTLILGWFKTVLQYVCIIEQWLLV